MQEGPRVFLRAQVVRPGFRKVCIELAKGVYQSTVRVLWCPSRAVASFWNPVGQLAGLYGMQASKLHGDIFLERDGYGTVYCVVGVAAVYDHYDVGRWCRWGRRRRQDWLAGRWREAWRRDNQELEVRKWSNASVVFDHTHVVQPGVGDGYGECAEDAKSAAVGAGRSGCGAVGIVKCEV